MGDFNFGRVSEERLGDLHPDLVRVVRRALSFGVTDISVLETYRNLAKQMALYHDGKTQIDGVNKRGKHNYHPSLAVDIMPYPAEVNGVNIWNDHCRWHVLAGLMYAAAAVEGVKIRWGGDWDGDGNNADSKFNDYPHFELV